MSDAKSDSLISKDILNQIDIDKIHVPEKKRRGRPKKTISSTNDITAHKTKKPSAYVEDDELILHLPISVDYAKNRKNKGLNCSEMQSVIDTINKETCSDKKPEEGPETNLSVIKDQNYKYQYAIEQLRDENRRLNEYLKKITPMHNTEVKQYPIDLKLFNEVGEVLIPLVTDIWCFWCVHSFDTLPTYLPIKYQNNIFVVMNCCFCSFNCAAAYNLRLNDANVMERYSLLKRLFYVINKSSVMRISDIEIDIAGPYELLDKFGGPFTIEEYRKNSKILGREYHKSMPAIIQVKSGYEEITNSKTINRIAKPLDTI